MNKRVKAKWLAALRSGKYKQARGKLRKEENRRCCLGVLCDVFKRETKRGAWRRDGDGTWQFVVGTERDAMTLPEPVWKWAGLENDNPYLDNAIAAGLNDSGKSFVYIADKIEKCL